MALRLVPYALRPDEEAGRGTPDVVVNYAANLDPLPGDSKISALPNPPAAGLPGAQLKPLVLEIVVRPAIVTNENGDEVLTFALDARLPQETREVPHRIEPHNAMSPWAHDMSSDVVNECVARVRNATPKNRYQRILDLADAMMAPLDAKDG